MDMDEILRREARNDGSGAYIYHRKQLSSWVAYGLSAYYLWLIVKEHGGITATVATRANSRCLS